MKKIAIILGAVLVALVVGFNYQAITGLFTGKQEQPEADAEPIHIELTEAEKALAIDIVMNDPRVQELLEGKEYVVAPELYGLPGVTALREGQKKLGVVFDIRFDKDYWMEYDWVYSEPKGTENKGPYVEKTEHVADMIGGLVILVDLYIDPGPEGGRIILLSPGPGLRQE
ncbi:hypothetical protein ACFLWY_03580 [Chloroflexota bacterium]